MNTYYFGDDWNHRKRVQAKNFEQSIRIYFADELFPEQHVYQEHIKDREYDSDLGRYIYEWSVSDPKIPIYLLVDVDKHEMDRVGEISLYEAVNVDFRELVSQQTVRMLQSPEVGESEEGGLVEHRQLPVVGDVSLVSFMNKVAMRDAHDVLKRKEAELEFMRREMHEAMEVMRKELDKKIKAIYMIETYMGIHEEIIQLSEGEVASEGEPLVLYQQKLYMDEEIGIWSDGGMDFQDIDKWDDWITEHYGKFLYEPRSICVFQIRRSEKEYSDSALENALMNRENFRTYFLIRNGTNLYRIWSNVYIGSRLFPSETEYQDIVSRFDDKDFSQRTSKEHLQRIHQQYIYGVIAIQGLIERTEIFGGSLRNVLNLMKLTEESSKYVKFVRDDEQQYWLTSGQSDWYTFIKRNQATIKKGSRVVIIPRSIGYASSKDDRWRTDPFKPGSWPLFRELYTVEEEQEGDKRSSWSNRGWHFLIRYDPGDEVWIRADRWSDSYYDVHKRKRRVPFRLYREEVLNFDEITIEQCEYYQKNRQERRHYLHMLGVLHWYKEIKREEMKLEGEFVKFLAGELQWEEDRYGEIRDAICWWRLKNKWKRAVTKDEAKAVRMILRYLRKGC